MKHLFLIMLLVFLWSCQKEADSLFPIESTETTTTTTPLKDDTTKKEENTAILTDTSSIHDSTLSSPLGTDTLTDDSTLLITKAITFYSSQAHNAFDSLLALYPSLFFVTQNDSTYTLTYIQSDSTKINTILSPFVYQEVDTILSFAPNSHITLFTQLSTLDHLEPLFLSTTYRGLTLKKQGSTITIEDTLLPFNSFSAALSINSYAQRNASQLASVIGIISGLTEVASGASSVVQGLNPQSKKTLALAYPRRAPKLNVSAIQLAPSFGFPYRLTKKSDSLQQNFSYIGDTHIPHVETITIKHSPKSNPLIELSLGNGDGLITFSPKTVGLIQSRFSSMTLTQIDQRQYFIALHLDSLAHRKGIVSQLSTINFSSLLSSEVQPITSLTMHVPQDTKPIDTTVEIKKPIIGTLPNSEITLLVNPEDEIARAVARLIEQQLKKVGVSVTPLLLSYEEYQLRLVTKEYTMVVGTTSQHLAQEGGGQYALSQQYWSTATSEKQRIETYYELPLFKLPVYIAIKKEMSLANSQLRAIYIEK